MKLYPSGLSNNQWNAIVKIILDKGKREYDLKPISNAMLYLVKTSCQWRMLPKSYPDRNLVYYYFRKRKNGGTSDLIMDNLNNKEPTEGIIDSQTVRTSDRAIEGYDGNKRAKGRKRHIVVDKQGKLLSVKVHSASVHDSKAAWDVLKNVKGDNLKLEVIYSDGAYRGGLKDIVKNKPGYDLRVILRNKLKEFIPLPKRWIVGRTFAWLLNFRRLAVDYEIKTDSAETMVKIAAIKLLLNKI
jgi:putative transposase